LITGVFPGFITTEFNSKEASALTMLFPAKSTGYILLVTKDETPSFSNQAINASEYP